MKKSPQAPKKLLSKGFIDGAVPTGIKLFGIPTNHELILSSTFLCYFLSKKVDVLSPPKERFRKMPKNKNTGLGRGLDAIFIDNSVEDSGNVTMLRISEIEPNPDQPRREFDPEALSQLADSIATHGLIQPIVVRSAGTDGLYQIIAGERRWRASKMAGLTEIPVIVKELDDSKAAQVALIAWLALGAPALS